MQQDEFGYISLIIYIFLIYAERLKYLLLTTINFIVG